MIKAENNFYNVVYIQNGNLYKTTVSTGIIDDKSIIKEYLRKKGITVKSISKKA